MNQPAALTGVGERVLLTGATDLMGREMLRTLINSLPEVHVVVLMEAAPPEIAERLFQSLLESCWPGEETSTIRRRIDFHAADLGDYHCGLAEREWTNLATGLTRVIHASDCVRFDLSLDKMRFSILDGIKQVSDLAREAHRHGTLQSFVYMSTAFVAGKERGLIPEDDLQAQENFRNDYERSKYEAEIYLRFLSEELPTIILRPSIIAAESRAGVGTAICLLREFVQKRPGHIVFVNRDAIVDIVPVGFVADATVHLAFHPYALGRCLHLCAGPQRSARLRDIVESMAIIFKMPNLYYVKSAQHFVLLRRLASVLLPQRRILRAQGRSAFGTYFNLGMEFDTKEADSLLESAGIRPPRVIEFLEHLFIYCIESDWGRLPVKPEELE